MPGTLTKGSLQKEAFHLPLNDEKGWVLIFWTTPGRKCGMQRGKEARWGGVGKLTEAELVVSPPFYAASCILNKRSTSIVPAV